MSDSQWSRMPYASMGKPGEQIGLFDSYIGNIMKKLKNLDIADNTIVIFTSDNGPDGGPDRGVFKMYNKFNHMRMGMMRGNKGKIQKLSLLHCSENKRHLSISQNDQINNNDF